MVERSTRNGNHTVSTRKVALSGLIGSVIEFYDFVIYGQAAALVFGPLFFPSSSALAGTLAAFATFAIGFFFRPVGGLIFGHFGDKMGRKTILYVTLLLMGGSTFLMGTLPTFSSVGVLAPILLVFLRIVQGLALGGEWSGAALTVTEHSRPEGRSFWGSVIQMGSSSGLVLGTLVITAISLCTSREQFVAWGWRIAFLLSLLLVCVGLYIRARIPETPAMVNLKRGRRESHSPLVEVLRTQPKNILLAAGITGTSSVSFYVVSVFTLSFGKTMLGVPQDRLSMYLLVAAALTVVAIPLVGALCVRIGRRRVLMGGIIGVGLSGPLYFWLLATGSGLLFLLAMVLLLAIFQSAVYAPQGSLFPALFEARFRYSGTSLGYNLGTLAFGGTVPFIATALFAWTGDTWPISLYMFVVATLSLACTYYARDVLMAGESGSGTVPKAPASAWSRAGEPTDVVRAEEPR